MDILDNRAMDGTMLSLLTVSVVGTSLAVYVCTSGEPSTASQMARHRGRDMLTLLTVSVVGTSRTSGEATTVSQTARQRRWPASRATQDQRPLSRPRAFATPTSDVYFSGSSSAIRRVQMFLEGQ